MSDDYATCEICGREFPGSTWQSRYCSSACVKAAASQPATYATIADANNPEPEGRYAKAATPEAPGLVTPPPIDVQLPPEPPIDATDCGDWYGVDVSGKGGGAP
jgi:hypothetical protein